MIMSDEELKQAIIAVYTWQYANLDSFNELLITLYRKADGVNKSKIRSQWPHIVAAIELWDASGDNGNDLFRAFKIGHFKDEDKNETTNL